MSDADEKMKETLKRGFAALSVEARLSWPGVAEKRRRPVEMRTDFLPKER